MKLQVKFPDWLWLIKKLPLFVVDAGQVSMDDSVVRTQVEGSKICSNGPEIILNKLVLHSFLILTIFILMPTKAHFS